MSHSFLHSSDLHLGRAFGGFPEGIRGRLREARHGVIARLAAAARAEGARDVLLAEAGDPALAQADRDLAEAALARLYALVQEAEQ